MTDPHPRIPWCEPSLDENDVRAVAHAVQTGFVNEGPAARGFEDDLRTFFDVPYAVVTPSGTMALALSLRAAGIGPGDTVLIPDITFIGTAGAVRLIGAEPILVDVDPTTFVMDVQAAHDRMQPNTKAMIPVHLTGRAAPMSELRSLAAERDCLVIEDAAEAVASRNSDGWLGTQSDAGCFSLAPTKIITSGQGGFVLTRRKDLYEQLIRLKDHGRLSRASDLHEQTGFNFKVSDLQCALARSQWAKLPDRIAAVQQVDQWYRDGLKDCPDLLFPPRPTDGGYLMWPDFVSPRRDALVDALKEQDIQLRPFWPPIHTQPAYTDSSEFPGATFAAASACWLPSSPSISEDQVSRVVDAIRKLLSS